MAALAGVGFVVAGRAALLIANSLAVATSGVPAALVAGVAPGAPPAALLVAAVLLLLPLLSVAGAALHPAIAAAPLAAVVATPARALPLPSSSSPRQSGAPWAKAFAL